MSLLSIASFLTVFTLSSAWDNEYDGHLMKQCAAGDSIYYIHSIHDNHHEDRVWEFRCQPSGMALETCSWSGFVNQYDGPLNFDCSDGVITGVESTNSNHDEDRIWNFRCCSETHMCHSDCTLGPEANDYDDPLSYSVSAGYFLAGATSVHNDHHEDRVWRYRQCKLVPC